MTAEHVITLTDISTALISERIPTEGFAATIIEQCGGKSAFDIVTDVLGLGIALDDINGFKEPHDTLEMLLTNKDVFMTLIDELASKQALTQDNYLIQITNGLDYRGVKKAYGIFRNPALLEACTPSIAAEYYKLAHLIVIYVVSKILLDVNHRLKGLPF